MAQEILQLLNVIGGQNASTAELRNATEMLEACYKNPEAIPTLIFISAKESNDAIRQLAAVEARKLIQANDGSIWESVASSVREEIKQNILNFAIQEKSILVRNSLAHIVSEIAKHEMTLDRWNGLMPLLLEFASNQSVIHREVGVYVLYTLLDSVSDMVEPFLPQLVQLFTNTIHDQQSIPVAVNTVQALGKIADFIEVEDKNSIGSFQALIPSMVGVLQRCLATGDDASVLKIFEVFDALSFLEAPLISAHFADLIRLFLEIGSQTNYSDEIRCQALSFLAWIVITHRKKLSKHGLVPVIIAAMFPIGAEDQDDSQDEDSPVTLAFQVINSLATSFPPHQVFPEVIKNVLNYSASSLPGQRKAAMLSIVVLTEGCADYMRSQIVDVLQLVATALKDPVSMVRKSACMAITTLSDSIGDEISEHHAVLLPLLFNLVDDPDTSVSKEALMALDVLLEMMSDSISPYMDGVMSKMVNILENAPKELKILATNCIGSVAHASGEDFAPYFIPIIERLVKLMALNSKQDFDIRSSATDAIGAISDAVSKEITAPYIEHIMKMAIEGMHMDKTLLNRSSYILFGILANKFGEEFSPYLPHIVPTILESCVAPEKEFSTDQLEKELDEGHVGDEEFKVTSGIANEKECSVEALGDLFKATKSAFLPFAEPSLNTTLELLHHFHENVRIAAVRCLLKFFSTVFIMGHGSDDWESGLPLKFNLHENVANVGKLVMTGILLMLNEEDDKTVVYQTFQELAEFLKLVGPSAVSQSFTSTNSETTSHVDLLANQIALVLKGQHACQVVDLEDTEESGVDGEGLAELDSLVIGSSADLAAALSSVLGASFASYFTHFFPLISKFYKESSSVSDRSMAIGSLAEIAEGLETGLGPFGQELGSLFMKALNDHEEEVKSNAAFGIGVVCQYSNMVDHYMTILQLLRPLFDAQVTNARDNACGAVCRMICTAPANVPLDHVLPVLLDSLPLVKDFNENTPVYTALLSLLEGGNEYLLAQLPRLFSIFGQVLLEKAQLTIKIRSMLGQFLGKLRAQYASRFDELLSTLPSEQASAIVASAAMQ